MVLLKGVRKEKGKGVTVSIQIIHFLISEESYEVRSLFKGDVLEEENDFLAMNEALGTNSALGHNPCPISITPSPVILTTLFPG